MKKLLITVLMLPFFALANDIPEEVFRDHSKDNWNWTAVSFSDSSSSILYADFTKTIKAKDGKYYGFLFNYDYKNKKPSTVYLARFGCDDTQADAIGYYEGNLFRPATNIVSGKKNSMIYSFKEMTCGLRVNNGKIIYGILTNIYPDLNTPQSFISWGWIKEEITRSAENDSFYDVPVHQYTFDGNLTSNSSNYLISCDENKIAPKSQPTNFFDLKDVKQNGSFVHFVADVCKSLQLNPLKTLDTSRVNDSIKVDKNTSKLKMEESKSKCESLGFKPKTEKFGNCVLELMK